jgi:arginyl-tRNA synthetase
MARGVAEISDGAACVFVEGHTVPLIVRKSDGGFGYASTDMAAIKQRIGEAGQRRSGIAVPRFAAPMP